MKAYTLKDVSKMLNNAPGISRQLEKVYDLETPRSKQEARIYTDEHVNQLKELNEQGKLGIVKTVSDTSKHQDRIAELEKEVQELKDRIIVLQDKIIKLMDKYVL